ncbi:MAG: glycerol-3-phosphate 1-O-acyltransferase PlsY [Alphaproteobacteria bacterium]
MSFLFNLVDFYMPYVLVAVIGGYLSGSVPYGLIISKMLGAGDIRAAGSGNIGATNVLRVAGKGAAAATLLLDALKGAVPVLVALNVHTSEPQDYAVMAGLAAFFGHLFPVWLKFKGGKGVATALGIIFAFSWQAGGILCGVWLMVAGMTNYSSAGALAAFGLAPLIMLRITENMQLAAMVLIISVVIWIKHHANIKRLASGTESKIGKKAEEPPTSPDKPA